MATKKRRTKKDDEIKFEIVEELGTLGERSEKGWQMEVNVVSWNGGAEKIDIRAWLEDHSKCTKGIRLSDEEAAELAEILTDEF